MPVRQLNLKSQNLESQTRAIVPTRVLEMEATAAEDHPREEFLHALEKVSAKVSRMAAKARKEHREGKTRSLPE